MELAGSRVCPREVPSPGSHLLGSSLPVTELWGGRCGGRGSDSRRSDGSQLCDPWWLQPEVELLAWGGPELSARFYIYLTGWA